MVLDQECWPSSMTHGWADLILHGKISIAQKSEVATRHKSLWSKFGCRLHSRWRMLMTNGGLLMGFYCVPSQSSLRERERERERERGFVDEQYLNGVIKVLSICYLWMLKWWSRDMVVLIGLVIYFLKSYFT